MKFFQKRWVAVTLCVLMILMALSIGRAKQDNIKEPAAAPETAVQSWDGYTRYVVDKTGLLSEKTIRDIAGWNASFDAEYNRLCGIGLLESVDGGSMEDAAFDWKDNLGLGDRDFFLLLDWNGGEWYFVYGDEARYYVDRELKTLISSAADEIFEDPDRAVPELYEELADWYADHISAGNERSPVRVIGGTVLFLLLMAVLVIVAVLSSLVRAGRRVIGGWSPMFVRHRPGFHVSFRPHRGPGVGRSASGRGGGFGGSRGSSGRGGGFGGKR